MATKEELEENEDRGERMMNTHEDEEKKSEAIDSLISIKLP